MRFPDLPPFCRLETGWLSVSFSEHWLPMTTQQGSLWTYIEHTSVRVPHSVLLLPEDADLSEHAASPEVAPGRGHNQAPQEDLNSVLRSAANGAALSCRCTERFIS